MAGWCGRSIVQTWRWASRLKDREKKLTKQNEQEKSAGYNERGPTVRQCTHSALIFPDANVIQNICTASAHKRSSVRR